MFILILLANGLAKNFTRPYLELDLTDFGLDSSKSSIIYKNLIVFARGIYIKYSRIIIRTTVIVRKRNIGRQCLNDFELLSIDTSNFILGINFIYPGRQSLIQDTFRIATVVQRK